MTVSQALLSFAAVAAMLTIIPGLDTAMVLRTAINQGRVQAYATGLGINAGGMAWGLAAAVGASALLTASTTAFTVLRFVGAAYMVWLGCSLLRKSWRPGMEKLPDFERSGNSEGGSLFQSWLKGAATNLLNPKVGVFYMAMIPQFIPPDSSPVLMGVALAAVHNMLGLIWFTAIIYGTHLARRWLRTPRVAKLTDRITGVVMIGFGVVLAVETR